MVRAESENGALVSFREFHANRLEFPLNCREFHSNHRDQKGSIFDTSPLLPFVITTVSSRRERRYVQSPSPHRSSPNNVASPTKESWASSNLIRFVSYPNGRQWYHYCTIHFWHNAFKDRQK